MKDFRNYHKKLWDNVKQIILDTERQCLPASVPLLKQKALAQMVLPKLGSYGQKILDDFGCFACVAAREDALYSEDHPCQYCPLVWGTEDNNNEYFCNRDGSPYLDFYKTYDEFVFLGKAKTNSLIRLCDKITNLPLKNPAEFIFDDEKANNLQAYFESNYHRPDYRLVRDIIDYVAAQGLDEEETVRLLHSLLYSSGITEEEVRKAIIFNFRRNFDGKTYF